MADAREVLDHGDDVAVAQPGQIGQTITGNDRGVAAEGAPAVRVAPAGRPATAVDIHHRGQVHVDVGSGHLRRNLADVMADLRGGPVLAHPGRPRQRADEVGHPLYAAALLVGHHQQTAPARDVGLQGGEVGAEVRGARDCRRAAHRRPQRRPRSGRLPTEVSAAGTTIVSMPRRRVDQPAKTLLFVHVVRAVLRAVVPGADVAAAAAAGSETDVDPVAKGATDSGPPEPQAARVREQEATRLEVSMPIRRPRSLPRPTPVRTVRFLDRAGRCRWLAHAAVPLARHRRPGLRRPPRPSQKPAVPHPRSPSRLPTSGRERVAPG